MVASHTTSKQLWEAYQDLKSTQKVAERFGCKKSSVLNCLKKNGYKLNQLIKYSCNEYFFEQNTSESFYWAGFIAADGCVKKRKSYKDNFRYELQIGLSKKDKFHIEKFKSYINYNGPIRDYLVKNSKRNLKWNDSWKSELTINSKQIFNDLVKFNVVPRKSLIYTFPEWLVDHPLVHHFMRGYFDGDGSFYFCKYKNKASQEYFSLRGTTEFLNTYRDILERENLVIKRDKPIRINSNIGVLEYGGNCVVKSIKEYLRDDSDLKLDRKWI